MLALSNDWVKAIMSASGNWRIGEDGKLVVTEVQSEKLKVKSEVEFGSQENPIGVTIYDRVTGQPRCAFFANDIWTFEQGVCGANGTPPDTMSFTP